MTGSGYPAPHAVVQLAEKIHEKVKTDPALKDRVEDELEALLGEVNNSVEHHERLAFIVVVRDMWTIENEFLTPTMKIRRDRLESAYRSQASAWYESGEKVIWEA